ncbi:MAG: alanine--tRNA ligase [Tissierellia bacterium]|nr:alanine--tRNA ligase [Tissierellia bacterium]
MKKLSFNELRKEYLDFFESKNHLRLKSYSLIPNKDKSLLLINAGMAPLKEYFTGAKKMSKDRATSSQRCLRTADIENVGKTHRHATYFEMLGNFSFGDYFKKEAIHWAWEFLTEVVEMDPNRLYVTVYKEDDEAFRIWNEEIGLPADRISRLGKEDNFWELEEGPCGPCSEIHYDRGEKYENTDDDRFLEIWNLVFTQFDKDKDGNYNQLPNPNIDTGMGLERLALVVEDAPNIFELEAFKPLLQKIEEISGKKYGVEEKFDESFRVIMDHTKAMTFLVYDGVIPSNEGRGYVLRRLIRRAYRHGKLLGIKNNFLAELVEIVMNIYSPEYPEVLDDKERVFKIINQEENKFQETIEQGLNILGSIIDKISDLKMKVISGKDAFKLYDTYGFPLDLTKEIARDKGLQVDEETFNKEMLAQKEQSRANKGFEGGWEEEDLVIQGFEKTIFEGYHTLESESKVIGILGSSTKNLIKKHEKAVLILDRTPFYAESGGQVGDTGVLWNDNCKIKVLDVKKTATEIFYHIVEVEEGELTLEDSLIAKVDEYRRKSIMKNHSATHLLNKALKVVLGNHINQAGSLVDEKRLRFDFTHFEAISKEDLEKIEFMVNKEIFNSLNVEIKETSLQESQEMGAVGLFEDKYKELVRVISMGSYSIELCGGTHVSNTSEIQMFKIVSESGIAAGIRRIEATSGDNVYKYLKSLEAREEEYSSVLKTNKNNITHKINELNNMLKEAQAEIKKLNSLKEDSIIDELENKIENFSGIKLLINKFEDFEMDQLRNISDKLKDKHEDIVIIFSSLIQDKLLFLTSVSKSLNKRKISAGDIVKFIAQKTGGNGGGRPDFASAGGKDKSKLDEAFKEVVSFIEQKL